jgi:hypothetical protein
MIAYKLLAVRKDGTIGPLFINKKLIIKAGEWMDAENHPTKGFQVRAGWHAMAKPEAPHLSIKGRQWFLVEISDFVAHKRPDKQGGLWYLANRMRVIAPLPDHVKTVNYTPKKNCKKDLQTEFDFGNL